MNFIIDREGKIIDLANNISDLMSNDQRALGTSLKIQSLLNGLPEIFPLEKSDSTKTFRNLVLKKDIGNFGTNPGQHYYTLTIQTLSSSTLPQFLCSIEKFVSDVDAVLNANQKCFNLYLKYLTGSLFEIDASSNITKILSDGPEGILQKFGINEGITILDLLDFNLSKKFKSVLNEVIETKTERLISHRFRTRSWELFIECRLNYKENDCVVVYLVDVTEKIGRAHV